MARSCWSSDLSIACSVAAAARFGRESEAGREGIICRSQPPHPHPNLQTPDCHFPLHAAAAAPGAGFSQLRKCDSLLIWEMLCFCKGKVSFVRSPGSENM